MDEAGIRTSHGAIEDYKKALELDPEDAVTWNNLGLLEEQLGYQEQARERYRVSDELLGILNEHGIDPESSAPAFERTSRTALSHLWQEDQAFSRRSVQDVLGRNPTDCLHQERPSRALDIRDEWLYLKG